MFTRDTRTETFLKQMGVDYRYRSSIPRTQLSRDWRDTNLSRPVPIREEAAVEYASLMESGSPAPAPVLCKRDGYEVLDGVQRLAASELLGESTVAAYVVESELDDKISAIRVLANARLQGRAEPPEWTKRRAVEVLVVDRGMSAGEVAAMGGWRTKDVESIASSIEWARAVQSIGGPELPDSIISQLSQHATLRCIRSAPGPTAAFLKAVKSARFSAEDAAPYIKDFFRPIARSGARHEVLSSRVDEFMNQPEVHVRMCGRKTAKIAHDVNLRRAMKTVVTVLDEIAASDEQLMYIDEFFKLAKAIHSRLHDLAPSRAKSPEPRTPADRWSHA